MKNKYSFSEKISTTYALICTKLFYKGARLIRRPFYCRGKSKLQYGEGFTSGHNCRFDLFGKNSKTLFFGKKCQIGDNVHIVSCRMVKIGDNCLMASNIFISDTSHGNYSKVDISSSPYIAPNSRPLYSKPVVIGDNVWIGENVCILSGSKIGDGCIVGANSVVTKDIPENCIAVGSPAKVIKVWNCELNCWIEV